MDRASSPLFVVAQTATGKRLVTIKKIAAGETILAFEKKFVSYSTNKTLRIDENTHQISADPNSPENFINHSCDANAYIDFKSLSLVARRPITSGEEITYNYCTSDYDEEDIFECHCQSAKCKKYIAGFKSLRLSEKLELREQLSPFLAQKLDEELAALSAAENNTQSASLSEI
ncbi:MAG: SET domain-containing protein [Patescibacteria group bacterium]|nr:SET domain-containing protein [Patescibacteria group bacterium]